MAHADWTCPSCHAQVDAGLEICFRCGSNRDGTQIADFGLPELELADEISIHDNTTVGDRMAIRAWRAAILSPLLCPPTLTLYSLWLILRIALSDLELSPRARGKFYLAMLVNIAVWIGVSFVYRYIF